MSMKKYILFLIIAIFVQTLSAQVQISGYITDETGHPLPGTHILIKKNKKYISGVITQENGYFNISEIESGKYSLSFSYIGQEKVTFPLQVEDEDIHLETITLKSANHQLEDINIRKKLLRINKPLNIIHTPVSGKTNYFRYQIPEYDDFMGQWQWQSNNEDTIFNLILKREKIHRQYSSNLEKKYTEDYWTVYEINDFLIGWYEVTVNDSVIVSNFASQIPVSTFPDINKVNILARPEQNMLPHTIRIAQIKNPLNKHKAYIFMTLLDNEKQTALWDARSLIKDHIDYVLLGDADQELLGFPTKVILKKIEPIDP